MVGNIYWKYVGYFKYCRFCELIDFDLVWLFWIFECLKIASLIILHCSLHLLLKAWKWGVTFPPCFIILHFPLHLLLNTCEWGVTFPPPFFRCRKKGKGGLTPHCQTPTTIWGEGNSSFLFCISCLLNVLSAKRLLPTCKLILTIGIIVISYSIVLCCVMLCCVVLYRLVLY